MPDPTNSFPYAHPVTQEQLRDRMATRIGEINDRSERYQSNAKNYSTCSLGLRVAALLSTILFALATYIFPDPPTKGAHPTPESWAMFFLLLTGIFVLADQVMTGTVSWARNKLAELLTGDVSENLQLEAIAILANIPDGNVTQETIEKVEGAIKTSQIEMQRIEREELDSWRKGVDAAWEAIKERTAADKKTITSAIEAQRKAGEIDEDEAKGKKGTLKVAISNLNELTNAQLSIDGSNSEWEAGTQSRVFTKIAVGHRAVVLTGTHKGGAAFRIEEAVLVKKGVKTEIIITLPSQ